MDETSAPIRKVTLKNKITCISEHREKGSILLGTSSGEMVRVDRHGKVRTQQAGAAPVPLSFIDKKGGCFVTGNWKGEVAGGEAVVKVSDLPIKYVYVWGEGIILASDSKHLYVIDKGEVKSSFSFGTYAMKIKEVDKSTVICITGYKVVWLRIGEDGSVAEIYPELNLHETIGGTETITSIRNNEGSYLCGTIGGWIIWLHMDGAWVHAERIMKVANERVTDGLWYRSFFILTTMNKLYVVDSRRKKVVKSVELAKDNGIVGFTHVEEHPGVFLVANVNRLVYVVDLSEALNEERHKQNKDLLFSPPSIDDIYNELLDEIGG